MSTPVFPNDERECLMTPCNGCINCLTRAREAAAQAAADQHFAEELAARITGELKLAKSLLREVRDDGYLYEDTLDRIYEFLDE